MPNDRIGELVSLFISRCSYISCERSVIEGAAALATGFPEDLALDLMRDHILSQGLADEVVE